MKLETEANGDLNSTNEWGFPWLICWAFRVGTRDFCPAWAALVGLVSNKHHTVTKSEPNEASLWKITLQKRGNSLVDAGTFIPPLTRFLYILLCGKSVPVYGRGHFTGLRR